MLIACVLIAGVFVVCLVLMRDHDEACAWRDSMVDLREDVRELRRNLDGYLVEDEKVLPDEEIDEGVVISAADWSAAELERMYELK